MGRSAVLQRCIRCLQAATAGTLAKTKYWSRHLSNGQPTLSVPVMCQHCALPAGQILSSCGRRCVNCEGPARWPPSVASCSVSVRVMCIDFRQARVISLVKGLLHVQTFISELGGAPVSRGSIRVMARENMTASLHPDSLTTCGALTGECSRREPVWEPVWEPAGSAASRESPQNPR